MIIKKIMILVCCVLLSLSAKAQQTFSLFPIYKVETAAQKKMFHGADYVFMADMWNPKHLSDSRHLWVPISWENGAPVLKK